MTATKKAPAKKTPAKKTTSVNKGKKCSVRGCPKDAVVKGRCSAHDAAERRKDPKVREKANEASRRSAAKRRAAKEAVAKK